MLFQVNNVDGTHTKNSGKRPSEDRHLVLSRVQSIGDSIYGGEED